MSDTEEYSDLEEDEIPFESVMYSDSSEDEGDIFRYSALSPIEEISESESEELTQQREYYASLGAIPKRLEACEIKPKKPILKKRCAPLKDIGNVSGEEKRKNQPKKVRFSPHDQVCFIPLIGYKRTRDYFYPHSSKPGKRAVWSDGSFVEREPPPYALIDVYYNEAAATKHADRNYGKTFRYQQWKPERENKKQSVPHDEVENIFSPKPTFYIGDEVSSDESEEEDDMDPYSLFSFKFCDLSMRSPVEVTEDEFDNPQGKSDPILLNQLNAFLKPLVNEIIAKGVTTTSEVDPTRIFNAYEFVLVPSDEEEIFENEEEIFDNEEEWKFPKKDYNI